MVLRLALGPWRARVVVDARVDALLVDAGLVRGTVAVRAAADDAAALVGVASEPMFWLLGD